MNPTRNFANQKSENMRTTVLTLTHLGFSPHEGVEEKKKSGDITNPAPLSPVPVEQLANHRTLIVVS
jgi:hypothetical protein